MAESEEKLLEFLECSKCGDWRTHYNVKISGSDKTGWMCNICGTILKPPKKSETAPKSR